MPGACVVEGRPRNAEELVWWIIVHVTMDNNVFELFSGAGVRSRRVVHVYQKIFWPVLLIIRPFGEDPRLVRVFARTPGGGVKGARKLSGNEVSLDLSTSKEISSGKTLFTLRFPSSTTVLVRDCFGITEFLIQRSALRRCFQGD